MISLHAALQAVRGLGQAATAPGQGRILKERAQPRRSQAGTSAGATERTSAQSGVAPARRASSTSGVRNRVRPRTNGAATRAKATISRAMYQVPSEPL